MFGRLTIAASLVLGTMVLANFASVPQATAQAATDRYFDYATRTWVNGKRPKRAGRHDKVPRKYKRRSVRITTNEAPGTIIVNSDTKYLYYVTGKNKAIRYGVGVGRKGFTWSGTVKIGRKQEWPTWTPPASMRARERAKGNILPITMKGGLDNPLGARALYLYKGGRDTIFRLHGTREAYSIGGNVSSGCIRLMNADVEDLYNRAGVGTKVIVIGPGQDASKFYTPTARLFGS
ncbi:MAG: L,D-transpeptidase [Rhizobiaceae bacterium]|nr:L,D-transpeptidase [Rhizobiaceae bacterium]